MEILEKIEKLVDKVALYASLSKEQKYMLLKDLNFGFTANLINDCKEIVTSETFEKLKLISNTKNPKQEELSLALNAFFKEVSEKPEADAIIQNNINLLISTILVPVKNTLTIEQKKEISEIFR